MQKNNPKIVVAAGGTGGHLFPAQAFAEELLNNQKGTDLLFAGSGLGNNRCFQKDKFPFKDICSETPYRSKISQRMRSFWYLSKGIVQSLKLLGQFKPDIVVGFGSFHAFPILFAAKLKKIPYVLFESNEEPGKVTRFFSKSALLTAIQFSSSADRLSGKTATVPLPIKKQGPVSRTAALEYFGLSNNVTTLLVFGGSQGAVAINRLFCEAAELLKKQGSLFQVIHLAGKQEDKEKLASFYVAHKIKACVKEFEDNMHLAWAIADFAVCRSGAATFAEQIAFEVPAILIPYPHGAEDHQTKNAEFMAAIVGGGILLPEVGLHAERLFNEMNALSPSQLQKMRQSIKTFKSREHKTDLCTLVCKFLSN